MEGWGEKDIREGGRFLGLEGGRGQYELGPYVLIKLEQMRK